MLDNINMFFNVTFSAFFDDQISVLHKIFWLIMSGFEVVLGITEKNYSTENEWKNEGESPEEEEYKEEPRFIPYFSHPFCVQLPSPW